MRWRRLEQNDGRIEGGPPWRLFLPPLTNGYSNAQIDDYGLTQGGRAHFPWLPGTRLQLWARFSAENGRLWGTAGFGFWNAPYGGPNLHVPALPQAVWFFHASAPNDLPLAPGSPGRGWFASTVDATTGRALALAPLAPAVLLLNQIAALRRRIWPAVQRGLNIGSAPLEVAMDAWHDYTLEWLPEGCTFRIDGTTVLETPCSPSGPLGFVCWIDNQFLVATPTGRFRWGTIDTPREQWLEAADIRLTSVKD